MSAVCYIVLAEGIEHYRRGVQNGIKELVKAKGIRVVYVKFVLLCEICLILKDEVKCS